MKKITLALSAAALALASTVSGVSAHQAGGMMQNQQGSSGTMMNDPDSTGYGAFGMMGPGMMIGGGMMGHGMMHMMTIMMDTDGDGAISLDEFQAVHDRMFNAMDINKDGKLTSDEAQVFMSGGSSMMDDQ